MKETFFFQIDTDVAIKKTRSEEEQVPRLEHPSGNIGSNVDLLIGGPWKLKAESGFIGNVDKGGTIYTALVHSAVFVRSALPLAVLLVKGFFYLGRVVQIHKGAGAHGSCIRLMSATGKKGQAQQNDTCKERPCPIHSQYCACEKGRTARSRVGVRSMAYPFCTDCLQTAFWAAVAS